MSGAAFELGYGAGKSGRNRFLHLGCIARRQGLVGVRVCMAGDRNGWGGPLSSKLHGG